ncbi:hypothetical protein NDU88_003953 [Pleurodeles waltl]|uniref:Uncharacterized protein n=1 Tax=Pleurodeles waltl TaxID=8319 RepID=A0AAV7T741_PLEWA|nr:hypothetical protein NDU88_003953 [Pleurodeles waltl]
MEKRCMRTRRAVQGRRTCKEDATRSGVVAVTFVGGGGTGQGDMPKRASEVAASESGQETSEDTTSKEKQLA